MAERTVQTDLLCRICNYNLRTLPVDGRCPECGGSVYDSLRSQSLLRNSDPVWLLRVRDGLGMIWRSVIAVVITIIVSIVSMLVLTAVVPRPAAGTSPQILTIILYGGGVVVFLIAPFLTAHGLWDLFQPEPDRPSPALPAFGMAPPLAIGGPISMVGGVFVSMYMLSGSIGTPPTSVLMPAATLVVCEVIIWTLLICFLRYLAILDERCERVPARRRRQIKVTRWGINVLFGASMLGTLIVLIMIRMSIVASPLGMRLLTAVFGVMLFCSLLVFSLSRGTRRLVENEVQMCEKLDDFAAPTHRADAQHRQ